LKKKAANHEKNMKTKKTEHKMGTKTVEGYLLSNGVVISPDDVYKLAALGLNTADIARYHNTTDDVIYYNFSHELNKGREDMKISLRKAMLENACSKMNPALQIFLAKNFLGMRDIPIDTEETKPLPWSDDL
jgi:hypothetical protein